MQKLGIENWYTNIYKDSILVCRELIAQDSFGMDFMDFCYELRDFEGLVAIFTGLQLCEYSTDFYF